MKLQNIIKYSTLLLVLLTLLSCSNFLNIKPKGFLIPERGEDYEALLNHGQIVKSSDPYPIYMTDDAHIIEVDPTGGFFTAINSIDRATYNLYTFQKEIFGNSKDDDLWIDSYNRIFTYNVIINEVMQSSHTPEAEKRSIQAEAYLARAFEYLNLVNAYAVHYDEATASEDLAVPLITEPDINIVNITRATVAEVYKQIEQDLLVAIPALPNKPKINSFRGSKPAALGILARMYLYQGKYKEALKYTGQSLALNDKLLDLHQYKVVDPDKYIGRTNVPSRDENPENIYLRLAPFVYGVSGKVYVSSDLEALFSKDDMRAQLYFTKNIFGVTLEHPLWLPFIESNLAISTPEVYLIAAECEARIGTIENALNHINKLRKHRVKNPTPLATSNKDEALKFVLEERRRELAFTGFLRLIDLKRLNKDPRWAKSITREVKGATYTLLPNSPNYVLPIPPKVLRFNPDMKPNERN